MYLCQPKLATTPGKMKGTQGEGGQRFKLAICCTLMASSVPNVCVCVASLLVASCSAAIRCGQTEMPQYKSDDHWTTLPYP